ncbi:tryptophan 2,3-dioxygenase family protein [Streptomyces sp. NBC_01214]|uniref:tryptophan 2,3-dioxygenase family protein n=1 Tax=Streptomyces sp. NBC_01214 TaxID=2903777 RepID=UPI00224F7D73|nr:tryptophan 2,3-dioxygenase family protein [Streptomyces sp. NBC_01214]MCX4808292.1 tryptophan 2,3-dioxygenase family protein [Streptomyces sp. NBC_01214]
MNPERAEADRWAAIGRLDGDGGEPDGIHLARTVTQEVRRTGKHFLPQPLLLRLSEIRGHRAADRTPHLQAFLDCMLDKHEGRYWNRTYLSLPLLELLLGETGEAPDPNRMATLLISDVIRFETQTETPAREPREPREPQEAREARESVDRDPPDPVTLRKRLHHALRFVAHDLDGPDADALVSAGAHAPWSRWADIAELLPRPTATEAGHWFDLTVQPVYVLHDEYFFIRALQAHEMIFTAIAADVRAAIEALRAGRLDAAADHVDRAAGLFDRASALFRMVATMRPGHFSAFRQFTQGASAIQSEQYKRFEILCGLPTAARMRSAAFTSVPSVRGEAEGEAHDTVVRAYLDLRRSARFDEAEWNRFRNALGGLEERHQRWKSTHRSLAARMLGGAHGSGYTAGVPYLAECLDNRLFWQRGDQRGAGHPS